MVTRLREARLSLRRRGSISEGRAVCSKGGLESTRLRTIGVQIGAQSCGQSSEWREHLLNQVELGSRDQAAMPCLLLPSRVLQSRYDHLDRLPSEVSSWHPIPDLGHAAFARIRSFQREARPTLREQGTDSGKHIEHARVYALAVSPTGSRVLRGIEEQVERCCSGIGVRWE